MSNLQLLSGERQTGESSKAVLFCNQWLRLGPNRSLVALTEHDESSPKPPTLGTLKNWSSRFDWAERADKYDAIQEDLRDKKHAEILRSGLAIAAERVQALKDLAAKLTSDIESADRINPQIVAQLRGCLADLANETGGRAKGESGGVELPPIFVIDGRPKPAES